MDQNEWKEWVLQAEEEYRMEAELGQPVRLKVRMKGDSTNGTNGNGGTPVDPDGDLQFAILSSGTAEIFGTELARDQEYEFQGRKVAVFSWTGCKLKISSHHHKKQPDNITLEEVDDGDHLNFCHLIVPPSLHVQGTPSAEYVAGETPMASYLNVHLALEEARADSLTSQGFVEDEHRMEGPRVLIVGPSDSGKTSLAKILLNYAIKEGRTPLFVDIDPGEASVTIPGSLSATPLVRPLDAEDEFSTTPLTSSTAPFVLYHGYPRPGEHQALYKAQVEKLAEVVGRKVAVDGEVRTSGLIIDTPSQFTESAGKELLQHTMRMLRVTVVLVIGDERLYSELSRNAARDALGVAVVRLAKSGGVVSRDAKYRKQSDHRAVREYFYGTRRSEISAYSTPVVFGEVNVRRVGEIPAYLTLGSDSHLSQTRMVRVDPGDVLLNSVLALTNVEAPMPGSGGAEGKAETKDADDEARVAMGKVEGFVVVSEVSEEKKRMAMLVPAPGRLPRRYYVMGGLKWRE
ncbi:hypothetical protein HDU93_007539 [Gonapodya sp. JEL0774]|nr:hypothetical protein HDU93_007539 [Gonapodya sp. JEL0774]